MAKASKKSETAKTPAKSAPARKPPTKAAKSASPMGSSPLVDTSLAAQNAARLLAAKLPNKSASTSGSPQSAMFKNMKESLSKPHIGGMDNMLNKSAPVTGNKSNAPFHGGKQVGHNQTFGADVNRTNVPRRTAG